LTNKIVYITGPHHISPPTYSTIEEREEAAKDNSSEGILIVKVAIKFVSLNLLLWKYFNFT
jgi:hypothetical protein